MSALQSEHSLYTPVLTLLHPREHSATVAIFFGLGLLAGAAGVRVLGLPLWAAAASVLAALLVPGALKWRADTRRYGRSAAMLSALLAAQGFHSVEHLAQWAQYHVLGWSARAANGLLSPANAEWVHFVWNWLVLAALAALVAGGMRGVWAWLLLAWASAHTLEHTYMFVRYLQVLGELRALGVADVSAQGLPGVLGRDGWLARSALTRGTFICALPGITSANRIDIHFWWNAGEMILLLIAADRHLRGALGQGPLRPRDNSR